MKQDSSSINRHLIIVCPPQKSCVTKVLRQLRGKAFQWVYLGENVTQFIFIERRISAAGQRREIGDKLQEIAGSLRQAYIDYIGNLSLANNSLLWWVDSLSEKNHWASKTFLYTCYLKLCQAIVNDKEQETLVFIGENKALRKSIVKNLAGLTDKKIPCVESPGNDIMQTLKNIYEAVVYKAYFFYRIARRIMHARRYRKSQVKKFSGSRELILLYNWVDARSFDANGEYRDNYFGGLARHISNRGKDIAIIPEMSLTVSYKQMLEKVTQKLDSFLLPESFMTIGGLCRLLLKTILRAPAKKAYPLFADIDISKIIRDELFKKWIGTELASNLLHYETIRCWKRAGIPISSFIYIFENQAWERAYCLALRKFYPSARIIGYQHSTVPKMLLNHFFSREELPVMPFPDKVITSGKYTEKLLKESGYEPAKVIRGGAIRYEYLLNKKMAPVKKDISNPVILVTPTLNKNEILELVWKVLEAFRDTSQYKIILKFHPDSPYRVIAKDIGALPQHFVVSEKPASELLQDASVLLYTTSTTSIEAIALGVPVIHIKSDFIVDRDNLADFPSDVRESVSTPGDIVKAIENLLKMNDQELARKRQLWAEVVAELFGPVDDSTYNLFL